jgi:hypothetical protein
LFSQDCEAAAYVMCHLQEEEEEEGEIIEMGNSSHIKSKWVTTGEHHRSQEDSS